LESKLSSLFSQSLFSAPTSLFVTLVKDRLRIWLPGSHDVVEDSGDFMGSRSGGLCCSELGSHTPKELAEVVFWATE